ncbi:hypothetical protein EH165_09115 [Nakamurella antarctica]|uniref:Uncharacterized protein n=2 Tax=Nakamurella antarctica TaxID=1902245 RepID=A0A3G8ZQC7_9ACTN|nr:hypothetical protein EH165_09115 [Nakamurella antarctica]
MGWFSRKKKIGSPSSSSDEREETAAYLDEWVNSRRGVEVYVEPRTSMTESTMMLVGHDGEFTRRPISSPDEAKQFARHHSIPIYDATVVGYPQRMRDYSRRQTLLAKRARSSD